MVLSRDVSIDVLRGWRGGAATMQFVVWAVLLVALESAGLVSVYVAGRAGAVPVSASALTAVIRACQRRFVRLRYTEAA